MAARRTGVLEIRVHSRWYKVIASLEYDALVITVDENNFGCATTNGSSSPNYGSDINSNIAGE